MEETQDILKIATKDAVQPETTNYIQQELKRLKIHIAHRAKFPLISYTIEVNKSNRLDPHAKASHGRTRMAGATCPAQIGTERSFKSVSYVSRVGCGVVKLGYP
jgi:hypothetical protein